MMEKGFTGKQLALALLGGAAIGAAVALLLAPRSGRELRSRMKELALSSKEKASRIPKAFGEATDAAREAFVGTLER